MPESVLNFFLPTFFLVICKTDRYLIDNLQFSCVQCGICGLHAP